MKICLIGNGFVGSAVIKQLPQYGLTIIASAKDSYRREYFDLIINCAGISNKWRTEMNTNVAESWKYERKVFDRIYNMQLYNPSVKLIHISSICATEDLRYGIIKLASEQMAKDFDYCILRLGGLVGVGLKKNVVFDLENNMPLHTKLDSIYNFICTCEVGKIVEYIVEHWMSQQTINVAANDIIYVEDIVDIMHIGTPEVLDFAKTEIHQVHIEKLQEFFDVKTSEYYIKQYLRMQ